MFTSSFPLARPCEIRAQSAQAIVRALPGMSAATLALSRPKLTNVRSVCRTRNPSCKGMGPYTPRYNVRWLCVESLSRQPVWESG